MSTDPRLVQQIRAIAKDIVGLRSRISAMERAAQSKFRSVENGSTAIFDEDGVLRTTIGQQPDGTYTVVDVNAPPPPVPSMPYVVAYPGSVTITWDGLTDAGLTAWQTDFLQVEVHISTTKGFIPDDSTNITSFVSTRGGTFTFTLATNTYYIKFVSVNTSRIESASIR